MYEMTFWAIGNIHKEMRDNSIVSTFDCDKDAAQLISCVRSLASYGDLAAPEAITRALVAERTGQRELAVFWLKVYQGGP